jgi:hypothetical protein
MGFVGRKPTNAPLTSDDIPNGIISAADLASGISGLITWQSVQTTGFTAVAGRGYPCNTTSAAFTVTLPATPSAGDTIILVDYAGTADTNQIVINPNGNKIEGGTDNLVLRGEREGITLTYIDSTQGWLASSGINEGTDALEPNTVSVEYLVVAGGGGGGGLDSTSGRASAGGGAGGFRTGTLTSTVATNITVTVGGGGAGGAQTSDSAGIGAQGSSSIFSTITSAGGGGGGHSRGGSGGAGGSGGGGGDNGGTGGNGNTPSTVPSQGNNGSASGATGTAGSGGGATSVGTTSAAGAGTASSITGSSVTYATGGLAGQLSPKGNGATNKGDGATGNTSANTTGYVGGSGIVIVKYPDTVTITNPGGGLTSSTATAGGFKVTSFTAGTGTIQFN